MSDLEVDGVKIGFTLTPATDGDQTGGLQFRDQLGHPDTRQAHVTGQPVLTGKTTVVMPGVAQEHGIGDLGPDGNFRIAEDEVGHLGEPVLQHGIGRV